jgi:hypothetical protein
VHDIVDDVTVESERAGRFAAERVLNSQFTIYNAQFENECNLQFTINKSQFGDVGEGSSEFKICLACPKGCPVVQTASGWEGLTCGRDEPALL